MTNSLREAEFPISRDPPEGGTFKSFPMLSDTWLFPISRDPPEGGTVTGSTGIATAS